MTKSEMFKKVKAGMHRDYVGKYGIMINRNGACTIVDENTITEEELKKLFNKG